MEIRLMTWWMRSTKVMGLWVGPLLPPQFVFSAFRVCMYVWEEEGRVRVCVCV